MMLWLLTCLSPVNLPAFQLEVYQTCLLFKSRKDHDHRFRDNDHLGRRLCCLMLQLNFLNLLNLIACSKVRKNNCINVHCMTVALHSASMSDFPWGGDGVAVRWLHCWLQGDTESHRCPLVCCWGHCQKGWLQCDMLSARDTLQHFIWDLFWSIQE